MNPVTICLLGDYSDQVLAHKAILRSLEIAQEKYSQLNYQWIQTRDIKLDIDTQFSQYGAIWCVPASPYENMQGVLDVIQFARVHNTPFLGTCGGYQHALIEYAQNVLLIENVEHAEIHPEAENPMITALSCALIEESEQVSILKDTLLSKIYSQESFTEKYHCSFGFNADYLTQFQADHFKFSAFNQNDEVRAFELTVHPFYIGTSFQPERFAFEGHLHPIVENFILSAFINKQTD